MDSTNGGNPTTKRCNMKKIVLSLVALLCFVGVAQAAKTTPVFTVNTYINTTAEQISSSAGTACKVAHICNGSTTNKVYVLNSSGVASTNGKSLWPNAGTATVESRCLDVSPVQISGNITTVDLTAWYAVAATGNVRVSTLCIP